VQFTKKEQGWFGESNKQQAVAYLLREFISSWDVYSRSMDVLASISACLLALLNAAAVPMGDFGSTPPSVNESTNI
jgi:hypothetical protein